ncbi:unnamed protein product [Porites evermanni]|uniref:Uncharacterized protein n=1 Tax=Porites evermanni TaxID=104178 RepID=A0ABN8S3G7_9CNID|nr:unnamed protein product [Porites evermanni]
MWKAWKSLFSQCVDKHAPLRSKRVPAMKSPWITKLQMHARNMLKLKAVRSEMLMTDNERDPHKTWQISNELTSRKTHSFWVKEIKLDNNSIRDPCELSSVFSNYFSSIGPTLINNIRHPTNGPLHFDYIMETEHRFDLKTTEPCLPKKCLEELRVSCGATDTALHFFSALAGDVVWREKAEA